jgi:transposase
MKKRELRKFTPEFRAQAARLVLKEGGVIIKIAEDLGIPVGTLTGWVTKFRKGVWNLETGAPANANTKAGSTKPTAMQQQEIDDLRRQVRRLTIERDILKKAMAYCIDVPK